MILMLCTHLLPVWHGIGQNICRHWLDCLAGLCQRCLLLFPVLFPSPVVLNRTLFLHCWMNVVTYRFVLYFPSAHCAFLIFFLSSFCCFSIIRYSGRHIRVVVSLNESIVSMFIIVIWVICVLSLNFIFRCGVSANDKVYWLTW